MVVLVVAVVSRTVSGACDRVVSSLYNRETFDLKQAMALVSHGVNRGRCATTLRLIIFKPGLDLRQNLPSWDLLGRCDYPEQLLIGLLKLDASLKDRIVLAGLFLSAFELLL
mmetsp:Transcript_21026/g.28289  ORF Transcript_21026/g.28289 Transcript_21026/m.28289 type:complete len:112 (+) Transcript_21026:1094-1429(+)